jgi:hypothetical protein
VNRASGGIFYGQERKAAVFDDAHEPAAAAVDHRESVDIWRGRLRWCDDGVMGRLPGRCLRLAID